MEDHEKATYCIKVTIVCMYGCMYGCMYVWLCICMVVTPEIKSGSFLFSTFIYFRYDMYRALSFLNTI